MKFNVLVAIIATVSLSAAYAQETATPTSGVVVINSNTSSTQQATAQPATVVEAAPVQDSKADLMRKARQNEEVKTEQKIVEKLEESRLKEEQARAERLFGNKLDAQTEHKAEEAKVEKVEAKKEEVVPQVTIQKVEIIQPAPAVVEKSAAKEEKSEDLADSKLSLKQEAKQEEVKTDRFFVGALLAAPNYNTSNVKTNYGLGVTVGMNLASDFVIEGSFLYSNHSVDSFWAPQFLFKDLDQYDVSIAAKYYILSGRLKPFVGGSVTYIKRSYTDRVYNWNGGSQGLGWGSQETDAVNMGLLAGVDFEVSKQILIGAGVDYNFNVMNKNEFRNIYNQYGMTNVRPLEEIDYYTLKVGAKFLF